MVYIPPPSELVKVSVSVTNMGAVVNVRPLASVSVMKTVLAKVVLFQKGSLSSNLPQAIGQTLTLEARSVVRKQEQK
jgi:hypothetical protein